MNDIVFDSYEYHSEFAAFEHCIDHLINDIAPVKVLNGSKRHNGHSKMRYLFGAASAKWAQHTYHMRPRLSRSVHQMGDP